MIELVFIACFATGDGHCENRSLLYQDIGMMTCMVHGQSELAQWTQTHPGWQIDSWKCRILDHSVAEL
ncbi:hypothetical protein [Mangrovicoccus sp. HB161399]|uniref:hypothetical protein n=1 Tax=Mangrovicoccus sp. HB161399 TaxID=2720392 RepID=UPI001556FC7D|nr:hypothetical protein [Mangrovicoccus sp. HB161399]